MTTDKADSLVSETEAPVDVLAKAGLALSLQYVNDDDSVKEKEVWNAAVKRCIEVVRSMRELREVK